jgi:hypothetical protein
MFVKLHITSYYAFATNKRRLYAMDGFCHLRKELCSETDRTVPRLTSVVLQKVIPPPCMNRGGVLGLDPPGTNPNVYAYYVGCSDYRKQNAPAGCAY